MLFYYLFSGTQVAAVRATDKDSGVNAEIKYAIKKGAYDAFLIDKFTGVVTVSSQLDYDKRDTYRIQIVATDSGVVPFQSTPIILRHICSPHCGDIRL